MLLGGGHGPPLFVMKKILLLLNTLKYLKFKQLYYRLHRRFIKPSVADTYVQADWKRSDLWVVQYLFDRKVDNRLVATFLNESRQLNLPEDWNNSSLAKLWTYNLHYFEDLLSFDAPDRQGFHQGLFDRWIADNPAGYGNGWEPYTLSLRVTNLLKAWLNGLELDDRHFESLYQQASFLSRDLEKHLLGNHYFVNLKALLFAGVVFGNSRWIKLAEQGLLKEIPEQIQSDGSNFELSPMYHSLILIDMLDMHNLLMAYPNLVSKEFGILLSEKIPAMLRYMELMSHPDGGVSFFNDSSDGIAPNKSVIETYAEKLDLLPERPLVERNGCYDLSGSGYYVAYKGGAKLIFDAAAVGPDYIPGHAHADTLSFEMSIGDERVFVNSGTSVYGLSQERLRQRSTLAHNTVELDKKDSSQVWSGFRVANRARVIERCSKNTANAINLRGAHNGYKSFFGGAIHSRSIDLSDAGLTVSDVISGKCRSAVARFHLHPDLAVSIERSKLFVSGRGFSLKSDLSGKVARLVDSTWHPEFGVVMKNKVLEIDVGSSNLVTSFNWELK